MVALDFPDTPTVGQVFDKWTWNGTQWVLTTGGVPAFTQFDHSGVHVAAAGIHVLGTTTPPGGPTFAYPVRMTVWANIEYGLHSAAFDCGVDILRAGDGGVVGTHSPIFVPLPGGKWYSSSISASWSVAAGQSTAFSTRFHLLNAVDVWSSSNGIWHIQPIA